MENALAQPTLDGPYLDGTGPVRDDAHDVGIGGELAVNFGLAAHALDARTDAYGRNLEHQGVAGNDGPAKASLLDSRKQNQLIVAILDLAQSQHGANLGQCLDDEDAGHHRRAGKVPLKEWFVNAHLLDADDTHARDQLDDAVDQQKWITMWEQLLDCLGVENGFHGLRIKRRGEAVNYRNSASEMYRAPERRLFWGHLRGRWVLAVEIVDERPRDIQGI